MRKVEIPELTFSDWCWWERRAEIGNIRYPGVYMLAISPIDLSGKPVSYDKVSYIGMTNAQAGLIGRWEQLNRSIHGKAGHSGGNSIFKKLGNYQTWKGGLDLYVCAMPVVCNVLAPTEKDLRLMGGVCYMEYEAFSIYKKFVNGSQRPEFNTR
ncbi:hypothetical protein ONV78_04910 [Hahella sp. CR1]|uniref:hypothetical protein n=1 Tax=Hahella sp. CR1 TaxID=2992807 RepID=UPI002442D0C2|nr:hypothetical protein [Hahella sp. CR1]MDG9667068.1 hypothetical protein [Hahella sp. CR1]